MTYSPLSKEPKGGWVRGPYKKSKPPMRAHPLYKIWSQMRQRCLKPTHPKYMNYGGRGITICARWDDFLAFVEDMGPRPSGASIDRIDVNGNYEPSNCRWASAAEQARNTRKSRMITYNGRTQCVRDWEVELGLGVGTINHRLKRGMPLEKAMQRC